MNQKSLYNIQTIHEELLLLLEKFDSICRYNKIDYSLHGGSLLGAIREHGFIPWDDDADVVLMRDNFDKLVLILSEQKLEEGYKFFKLGHSCKLLLKRSNKPLVCIDIIVCDYISSNVINQKIKFWGLAFFKVFTRDVRSLKITKSRGKYIGLRFFFMCCACLLGMYFSKPVKEYLSDNFMKMFSGDKKCLHRSNDQYVGMVKVMPNYVMNEYMDIDFYHLRLQISKYYHEILVNCYGFDYMIPHKDSMASHTVATNSIAKNLGM